MVPKNTRRRYVGGRRTSGRGWDPVPTNVIFFVVLFIFTSRSSKQRVVGDADPYGLLRDGRLRVTVYASTPDPQPPCRGRRPRRPAVTVTSGPTAVRRPSPGHGMLSRHIMRRTARFPPAVGVGVLDDPSLRSPPAPRRRRGCGRLRPPAKGEPPARVPPLTPSCASWAQGEFRAAARVQGLRPWTPPAFL